MLEIRRGKALALIVEAATVTDTDGATGRAGHAGEDGTYATPDAAGDRTTPLR